jgi:hypothetical protein
MFVGIQRGEIRELGSPGDENRYSLYLEIYMNYVTLNGRSYP